MTYSANKSTPKGIKYWLIKFAPFRTSWADIVRRGIFTLRGIRSPEARNNLHAMQLGDRVLFCHSQQERAIVGVLEVTRTAYPDPGSADPQWVTCDYRPIKTLEHPVPLSAIKQDTRLQDFSLVRRPRLSVMPVRAEDYEYLLAIAELRQVLLGDVHASG